MDVIFDDNVQARELIALQMTQLAAFMRESKFAVGGPTAIALLGLAAVHATKVDLSKDDFVKMADQVYDLTIRTLKDKLDL